MHHVMLLVLVLLMLRLRLRLICLVIAAAAPLQANEATFDVVIGIARRRSQHVTICGIQIVIGEHKLCWRWYNHRLLPHSHVRHILSGQRRSVEARLDGGRLCG